MQQQLELPIRNAGLYSAMRRFVVESFDLLRADQAAGADLTFSVAEHRRSRDEHAFYEYRPMTERFVRDRLVRICELPITDEATWAVASDPACGVFLRAGRADVATDMQVVARDELLVPLLMSMAELRPDFELDEQALLNHYLRLEQVLYAEQRRYVAITPLWGVRLVYGECELAPGVTLRQVDPELLRIEWPEAAQLNWGEFSRDGLPAVALEFERAIGPDDDASALDPLPAVAQVVSAIRALAGGSVHAGPAVFERLDFRAVAPRPVPAIAAQRCGTLPSKIDATVARSLPTALRRLSGDPDGSLARALERYQHAATARGLSALRGVFDALIDIYADERETMSAALRMAVVVGASLPERQQFVAAMRSASLAIRNADPADEALGELTRLLAAVLRTTIAAALIGELPISRLQAYADAVLLGERERKRLGVAAHRPTVG